MEWLPPPLKGISALLSVYSSVIEKTFPIDTVARQELQRDRLFPLLTPEQRGLYIAAALEIGAREAAPYCGESILSLAAMLEATIEEFGGGIVVAGSEVYAEYDSALQRIRLHRAGVAHVAKRFGQMLPQATANQTARDLLVAHELFHHLEATRLGPVHKTLPAIAVPVLGGFWKVQRRVLRTREIAAHSFAHTLVGMPDRFA